MLLCSAPIKFVNDLTSGLAGMIAAVVAALVWWLFLMAPVTNVLAGIVPLELTPVESRDFGGFMLSITIGVVAIGCSLPIGIFLALRPRRGFLKT